MLWPAALARRTRAPQNCRTRASAYARRTRVSAYLEDVGRLRSRPGQNMHGVQRVRRAIIPLSHRAQPQPVVPETIQPRRACSSFSSSPW